MKNIVYKSMVMACILAAPTMVLAQAQDSAPLKIGIINIQAAIAATQEGKVDLAKLQKKYSSRRDDLQQQAKDITALQDRLQNQSGMLSDQERYELTRQLNDKQRRFKEAQNNYQYDTQSDEQDVLHTMLPKMQKLINQYATKHHFALIIDDQQLPVYYAAKQVDITQDIVKIYDASYPAATASAQTPTAAAASASKH